VYKKTGNSMLIYLIVEKVAKKFTQKCCLPKSAIKVGKSPYFLNGNTKVMNWL
jgi:hypothetical protein